MEVKVNSGTCRGRASVLILDDHDGFRSGLAAILAEEGFAVEEASSGEAALARAVELRPNVVLIDEDMPGMSGAEAARRVLQVLGTVRVIMLGFLDDRPFEVVPFGAHGYLSKAAPLEETLARVTAAGYHDRDIATAVSAAPSAERASVSTIDARVCPVFCVRSG